MGLARSRRLNQVIQRLGGLGENGGEGEVRGGGWGQLRGGLGVQLRGGVSSEATIRSHMQGLLLDGF